VAVVNLPEEDQEEALDLMAFIDRTAAIIESWEEEICATIEDLLLSSTALSLFLVPMEDTHTATHTICTSKVADILLILGWDIVATLVCPEDMLPLMDTDHTTINHLTSNNITPRSSSVVAITREAALSCLVEAIIRDIVVLLVTMATTLPSVVIAVLPRTLEVWRDPSAMDKTSI
jgi:hypothetical protein